MRLDQTIQKILTKISQIDLLIGDSNKKNISANFLPILIELASKLKENISLCEKNLDFLNSTIIQEEFQKLLQIINSISDSLINYLTYITSNSNIDDQKTINDIHDIYECFQIYFSNFQQIIDRYSKSDPAEILYNWLGLETFLFTFCVNIQSIPEFPFFNLKIVNFYKSYEKVNSIESTVSAVTSFCGTGKTTCLPLILLCRSFKETNKVPFMLFSSPNSNHVFNFFRQHISKFVIVTSNKDEYEASVNNYMENPQSQKKLILGVFSPFDVLSLINSNQKSFKFTRIIVDEIHNRSTFSDVLLAKIVDFTNDNLFTLELNAVLMSSSISPSLLSPFKSSIKIYSFCEKPQYEIVEKPPIYDHFIKKIKTEIVPDEVIKVIDKMSEIDSMNEVEEGHILCFLPGSFVCEEAKKAVVTLLNNNEETETKRKIVIINTTLKKQ